MAGMFSVSEFGTRVRKLRRDKEISQRALADMAGVTPDLVFKYEHGVFTPGADKVMSIANALGCSPNYLLGWVPGEGEKDPVAV